RRACRGARREASMHRLDSTPARDHVRRRFVPSVLSIVLMVLGSPACSPGGGDPAAKGGVLPPEDAGVGGDPGEIVRGVPDRGRDPAVVAIEVDSQALCTGTLIAPDVVLTARHCLAETSETVRCPSTTPQVGPEHAPASLAILTGDNVTLA